MSSLSKPAYINYPQPKEIEATAEACEYVNPPANNPVVSGYVLEVLSNIVLNLGFVQRMFWNNAGFGELKKLDILKEYPTPCFNTAVIPTQSDDDAYSAQLASVETPVDTQFYTCADFVKRYAERKVTPTQVVTRLLEIIAQPPHKAAINQVLPELALAAAEASTKRYEAGASLGPMDGVPIVVKDELYVRGYETTFGSARVFDKGDCETAWCIKKLEEAGAIIIAKSAMHELGSDTTNCNPTGGHTPRNPYNDKFYCGGSSGGSAYCVSSGIVPIAVGCDGGGSIRIPSNYCGIYGLKTSSGRLSTRPTPALSPANGVAGPMCATIEDLKTAYRIMAVPDPEATASSLFPLPRSPSAPLTAQNKKVVGMWKVWFDDCDPKVSQLVTAAVEGLEKQGYEVVQLPSIPYLSIARRAHSVSIITDMASFINHTWTGINAPNRVLFSVASQSPAIDIFAANKVRAMMMSHFAALWKKYPGMIFVNPVVPMPGAEIVESHLKYGVSDGDSSIRSMKYVALANFIGTPAINSVVGYDEATKMPISMMGMSEWGKEEDLLGWAAEVSVASGLSRKKPDNWVDALDL